MREVKLSACFIINDYLYLYLAGQSVVGILNDSELNSTLQGKYNYVVVLGKRFRKGFFSVVITDNASQTQLF